MSVGSASTVSSRVTCSSTPPSLAPGESSPPTSSSDDRRLDRLVEPNSKQVQVHRRAVDRMTNKVLDDDRGSGAAVDLKLEHRARMLEREAQGALVDLERDRILAAAVDDSGDAPLTAQAPSGARSGGVTVAYGEGSCSGLRHGGERW